MLYKNQIQFFISLSHREIGSIIRREIALSYEEKLCKKKMNLSCSKKQQQQPQQKVTEDKYIS